MINTCSSILTSQCRAVCSGVPQGSILGPLLFNIFTADLSKLCLNSKLSMYADDIQLLYSFRPSELYIAVDAINNDLKHIYDWTQQNTLLVNPIKSQNILFGTSYQLRHVDIDEISIKINNDNIPFCNVVKNLGVFFDSTLSFSNHVTNICRKAYSCLKLLHSFKKDLDSHTKILLIETMVLSHLHYADVVYGPCISQADKHRLQRVQNSCVRYFTTVPQYSHISPYLRNYNLLNMSERRFIHIVGFILNVLNSNRPAYLYSKINWRSEIHSRDLRQVEKKICIPSHKSERFKCSFSYMASYIFNNLPAHYHNLSVMTIKNKLKLDILSSAIENFNIQLF